MPRTTLHWGRKNHKVQESMKELQRVWDLDKRPKGIDFSIPAGDACPFKGACAGGCFGFEGMFRFPVVEEALERNWEAVRFTDWQTAALEDLMILAPDVVRIHAVGDYWSWGYMLKWVRIAQARPEIVFYGYTKSIEWVRNLAAAIPENTRIAQSEGGLQDNRIDYDKSHSRVFRSREALLAAGYKDSSESDVPAILGERKIGLVLHGQVARSREKKLIRAGWVK
jgi:hypothetical protein